MALLTLGTMATSKTPRGVVEGYRSGLEEKVAAELKTLGIPFSFESEKIAYVTPMQPHKYTPDFIFHSGLIVETKGRFVAADRKKHLLIQKQHPEKDIRFVFSNPNQRITKGSKTTYAMWCDKHGFQYAKGSIPLLWLRGTKEKQ